MLENIWSKPTLEWRPPLAIPNVPGVAQASPPKESLLLSSVFSPGWLAGLVTAVGIVVVAQNDPALETVRLLTGKLVTTAKEKAEVLKDFFASAFAGNLSSHPSPVAGPQGRN